MMAGIESIYSPQNPPGFRLFCQTTKMIKEFEKEFEETHMKWLEDILVEAKKCFGKQGHHLLPKTSADKKRKRGRRRRASQTEDGDTSSTSRDSLESKETIRAPAKRQRANDVNEHTSQEEDNSTSSTEPSMVVPVAPCSTERLEAAEAPQLEPAIKPQSENKTESGPPPVGSGSVEAEAAPVRRSTRRATTARPKGTTRQSTRTRGGRKAQQSGSESTDETDSVAQGKKSAKAVAQIEAIVESGAEASSPSLTEPPPRNSPRTEIESYYKNRVKRLINHHENMMTSGEESTPPKRARTARTAVPKTPDAPGTSARATRSRITKPIRGGGGVRKAEEKVIEATKGGRRTPDVGQSKKNLTPVKPKAVGTSLALYKQARTAPENGSPVTKSNEESDGNRDLKVAVVGVKSEHEKEVDRESTGAGNEVTDGQKESRENQGLEVEQEYPDDQGQSSPAQPERCQDNSGRIDETDGEAGSSSHPDTSFESAHSHQSPTGRETVEETDGEDEDDVVLPSPLPKKASLDTSALSGASSGTQSESGRVLRKSNRVSQSKRRSSTYHRYMGRSSVARKSTMSGQLSATIAEEQRGDGRRLTRSRTKKLSQESVGRPAVDDGVAKLKRKSQDSDDEASSQVLAADEDRNRDSLSSDNSAGSNEEKRSTPPSYGVDRVTAPHAKSLLNPVYRSQKASMGRTSNAGQSSFVKRNTPLKKTLKERKMEIMEKQRREEEVKRKLEDERKQRLDEIKSKREQRARKVAEARAKRIQLQSEKKKKLEERQEQKQALSARQRDDKRREELEKRLRLTKKKQELELRRKQEQDSRLKKIKEQEELKKRQEDFILRRKEYEEQERIRKVEEARKLAEQRKMEAERQREQAERKRIEQEETHEREMMHRKEERERDQKDLDRKRLQEAEQREREKREREEAEAERVKAAQRALKDKERQEEQRHLKEMMRKEQLETEKARAEQERLKASILKHNTSQNKPANNTLNTTITKEQKKSPGIQSYEMTPKRIYVATSEENYGIEDLDSGDSTDDEENPRKTIPKWAEGTMLRALCLKQFLHPPDMDYLFPPIDMPNLEALFPKKRARFFKRTSSAVWNSPPERYIR